MARDYYEVLQVPKHASAEKLKDAYRKLARQLHPDVNKAADAQQQFTELQEAYDTLSDEAKRRMYDQVGHAAYTAGAAQAAGASRGGGGGWPGGGFSVDDEDLGSVFDAFFGGAGRGSPFGGGARQQRQPQQPAHKRDLEISFMTAIRGGVEPVRIATSSGEQRVEVKVPPGVLEGAKLRAKLPAGSETNEMLLTVRIGRHPLYRRVPGKPLDLELDLPLSIDEAALGVKAPVPTPSGPVTLTVPPGASSGRRLRARGHGIKPASGDAGDLLVRVQIVVPDASKLSQEEREALRAIGRTTGSPRSGPDWPSGAEAEA